MKLPGSHLPPASRQLGRGGGRTRQRLGSVGAVRPGVIAGRGLVHCRGKTEPPRILLEGGRLQRSMWHLAQVGRDKPELPRGHPIMCRSLSHPALASFLPSPGWGPVLGVGLVYKNLSWMRPAPEGGGPSMFLYLFISSRNFFVDSLALLHRHAVLCASLFTHV